MADLTKQEELERLKKSLDLTGERLNVVIKRIPELRDEVESLIVRNEVYGYKSNTIKKASGELEDLEKEQKILQKTISALQKVLPQIEKEARIEIASTETVKTYHDAYSELTEIIKGIPSLDTLITAVASLQQFREDLDKAKSKFLSISKDLANVMVTEKLKSLDGLTIESLRVDRNELDYSKVLKLSDNLIDLSENVNKLQYALFQTAIFNPVELFLPLESKIEPVYSEDGLLKIEKENELWNGFLRETLFIKGQAFENWKRLYNGKELIAFEELHRIADGARSKEKRRVAKEHAAKIIFGTPLESWNDEPLNE